MVIINGIPTIEPRDVLKKWQDRVLEYLVGDDPSDPIYFSKIQDAIDSIYTIFAGIPSLWWTVKDPMRTNKIVLCYQYLVMWLLADGDIEANMGAIPLTGKRIKDVEIKYRNGDLGHNLDMLTSNSYGLKALFMIRSSGYNLMYWVGSNV